MHNALGQFTTLENTFAFALSIITYIQDRIKTVNSKEQLAWLCLMIKVIQIQKDETSKTITGSSDASRWN